ncbi:MAG: hypothetical protein RBT63_03895 [Bdellovibrionales bacterium]|jgi:hypothetical protein|nr:hypothetical protein [Bdellovibrionales bacterium]
MWRYHVVLEHKGLIFDLDYLNRLTVSSVRYYIDSFIHSDALKQESGYASWKFHELGAFVIPGERYLLVPAKRIDQADFSGGMFGVYRQIPLSTLASDLANDSF